MLPPAYLSAISAILGISATSFYILSARGLDKQLDERLLALGQAAIPSLNIVKSNTRQDLRRKLSWNHLLSTHQQSLEWFDANGQFLAQEGTNLAQFLPFKALPQEKLQNNFPLLEKKGDLRSVTIAVYGKDTYETNLGKTTPQVEGYIRASQSRRAIEATLSQLRLKLVIVGILLLIITSMSSIYLTYPNLIPQRPSSKPIDENFQRREQFSVNLAHHLRNLLTRINLSVELMLRHSERFHPSDFRKLTTIDTATQQMQRLVEDLLFLARHNPQENPTKLKKLPLSLEKILHSVVKEFQLKATTKKITLEVRLSPEISVKGDVNQLKRLFSILLNNALKYTDAGGKVTISLSQSRGIAVVTVDDTGIGIPPESLPFVFQWFWHSEMKRERQEEGLGLGLAIAQAIVEQHEGKISVVSREGIGSSFQVCFPIDQDYVNLQRGKTELTKVGFLGKSE